MTAKWLFNIRPFLITAFYYWVVGIDPRAWIRPAVNVTGPKHDFCEALQSATLARGFGAHDIFYWIAIGSGDDSAA